VEASVLLSYTSYTVCAIGRHSVSGWVVAPSVLVPSDGVFGRFDLVALCGCHTLNVCLFVIDEKMLTSTGAVLFPSLCIMEHLGGGDVWFHEVMLRM
jgi:hypothetical protein